MFVLYYRLDSFLNLFEQVVHTYILMRKSPINQSSIFLSLSLMKVLPIFKVVSYLWLLKNSHLPPCTMQAWIPNSHITLMEQGKFQPTYWSPRIKSRTSLILILKTSHLTFHSSPYKFKATLIFHPLIDI